MANEKWRLDLKGDIRQAVAAADGFGIESLEPHDYQEHAERVLAAVLPHFEAAYKRGEIAGKSKAGYATRRKPKEGN